MMAGDRGDARDVGIVIPAAGAGVRFGGRKAFVELEGQPLLRHVLRAFRSVEEVREIVVAVAAEDVPHAREEISKWEEEDGFCVVDCASDERPAAQAASRKPQAGPRSGPQPQAAVVGGGPRRQDSVWAGVRALSPECGPVLVHDAARPLIHPDDIRKVIAAVREAGAAVLGHPATDSVKEAAGGVVVRELPRGAIWLVQTPQGARMDILRRAFEEGGRAGREVTDEVGLLFAAGVAVRLVEGRRTNIKVTFPEDLPLARFFLLQNSHPRP